VLLVALAIVSIVIERIALRIVRSAYWKRIDRDESTATTVDELTRIKRQRTLVTLLESIVRYSIYSAAVIVAFAYVNPSAAGSVLSAGLLVVLVGFGMQRILGDAVAGALIVFDGHFSVGDVVTVHQYNVTGIVEKITLRSTLLRTFGGDRIAVLNSAMLAVTRWAHGHRAYRIDATISHAAVPVLEQLCEREASEIGRWVTPPTLHIHVLDDERVHVRCDATVAPSLESVVDAFVVRVRRALGDGVIDDVDAVAWDSSTIESWRAGLMERQIG
jgi:small conductance mechanosensitive channel